MGKNLNRAGKQKHGMSTGRNPTRRLECNSEKYHCTVALLFFPSRLLMALVKHIGLDGPLAWPSADTPAV